MSLKVEMAHIYASSRLYWMFLSGYLGELKLIIPWSNLKTKPVKVFIENVYLLAAPKSESTVRSIMLMRKSTCIIDLKKLDIFGRWRRTRSGTETKAISYSRPASERSSRKATAAAGRRQKRWIYLTAHHQGRWQPSSIHKEYPRAFWRPYFGSWASIRSRHYFERALRIFNRWWMEAHLYQWGNKYYP